MPRNSRTPPAPIRTPAGWLSAGGLIGYVSSGLSVFFTLAAIFTFVVGSAYVYAGLQVLTWFRMKGAPAF